MRVSFSVSFNTSVTFRVRVISAEAAPATTTNASSVAVAAALAHVKSNKWLLKTKLYKTVFSNIFNGIIEEIPPIVKC